MKINILGKGHAYMLAEMLTAQNHIADCNSPNFDYYDVTLGMGLWNIPKPTPKNFAVFAMGSDVWRDNKKHPEKFGVICPSWKVWEKLGEHDKTDFLWSMPINTDVFDRAKVLKNWVNVEEEKRDVLLYAKDPLIYELGKILHLVKYTPDIKYTLLGGAAQNFIMELPENLLSVNEVPYHLMPQMYLRHTSFMEWLSTPGAGCTPVMNLEACAMGINSYINDEQIKKVPVDRCSEVAIPRLIDILKSLK